MKLMKMKNIKNKKFIIKDIIYQMNYIPFDKFIDNEWWKTTGRARIKKYTYPGTHYVWIGEFINHSGEIDWFFL